MKKETKSNLWKFAGSVATIVLAIVLAPFAKDGVDKVVAKVRS